MPRKPRYTEPGLVYHLISRFVDRDWFIKDEEDRECYLTLLGRALSASDWRCFSYGVMSNHLHLATVAGAQTLDSWVRRVHAPFADWMNRKYDRIGVMFVRGPKDFMTPPDRVGSLIAYIHNNPVRAKVVTHPAESNWTSHRAYLGLEPAPRWLHVDEGLSRAGFSDRNAFERWVALDPGDPSRDDLERSRTLNSKAQEPNAAPASGYRRQQVNQIDPNQIVERVAAEVGLSVSALRSRRRQPRHVLARRVAAHCADSLGISGVTIASALGISQQGVSSILRSEVDVPVLRELAGRVLQRLELDRK